MKRMPKMTVRRTAGLLASLSLLGVAYVIIRTDPLIRQDLSWALNKRNLLIQRRLSLMGVPVWGLRGHTEKLSNNTEIQGNITERLQNVTRNGIEHLELRRDGTTSARNPENALNPENAQNRENARNSENARNPENAAKPSVTRNPAPFDTVNRLRGYAGVLDASKQLDMRCGVCSLVSSSGQLLHYKAGNEIDQADCVIRMNDAPVVGYEEHVGSRTTLRVSCFQSIYLVPVNSTLYKNAGNSTFIGWGPAKDMQRTKGKAYQKLAELDETYRDLDVYMLTQGRMDYSGEVYRKETGKSLVATKTWLSTGWFTMLLALELCDVINVYGLSSEHHCRTHPNDNTRYHYFKGGWPKDSTRECQWYRIHERVRTGAHRFVTEKSIFARWAKSHNITFHYPSWDS